VSTLAFLQHFLKCREPNQEKERSNSRSNTGDPFGPLFERYGWDSKPLTSIESTVWCLFVVPLTNVHWELRAVDNTFLHILRPLKA
jgi:hypothetical protein